MCSSGDPAGYISRHILTYMALNLILCFHWHPTTHRPYHKIPTCISVATAPSPLLSSPAAARPPSICASRRLCDSVSRFVRSGSAASANARHTAGCVHKSRACVCVHATRGVTSVRSVGRAFVPWEACRQSQGEALRTSRPPIVTLPPHPNATSMPIPIIV